MSRTMIQASVTMNQLQKKLDTIGQNIANSNTTGYKARQSEFSSLLFQQMDNFNSPADNANRNTPAGIRIGAGARIGAMNSNLQQGSIITTDRALDTALLSENLFYQVQVTENNQTETHYTRDGALYLNPVGNGQNVMLTTKNGHPVLGANGPITFANNFESITIRENGQVAVDYGTGSQVVGTLAIVETERPRTLEATENNLFRVPDAVDADIFQVPNHTKLLKNQALESSNVDLAQEMSELILTQRAYQMNARTISMSDQMQSLINQVRT